MVNIVLVTDPGPDPDDVKALLVLGVLHRLGRVVLLAVIANGGGNARQRAALARCVLDHIGVCDVRVGIGSAGVATRPQGHEFDLEGIAEADAKLESGPELLLHTLRTAAPKSVRVVLISSLRDFSDALAADSEAVLASVHMVAVYDFCFANGLPMTVTSRHAVPLLPMQLARSFAQRTDCRLMRYLAAAQSLGLEGLWQKLCAGQLPPRCSKQWYFETFCCESAAQFEANQRQLLDKDADIAQYLNGFVKPYDVCALMTVLPFCAHFFDNIGVRIPVGEGEQRNPPPQPSLRARAWLARLSGRSQQSARAHHLLLLTSEDEVPQVHVLNMLRDTYHEVILMTREQGQRPLGNGPQPPHDWRTAKYRQARFVRKSAPVCPAPSPHAPLAALSLRGTFGAVHIVSPSVNVRSMSGSLLTATADDSPSLPIKRQLIVHLLDEALESARMGRRAVMHVAGAVMLSLGPFAFIAAGIDNHVTMLRTEAVQMDAVYLTDSNFAIRARYYVTIGRLGGAAMMLTLFPGSSDRRRALFVGAIWSLGENVVGAWKMLPRLLSALYGPPYNRYAGLDVQLGAVGKQSAAFWEAAWTTHLALRILNHNVLWLLGVCLIFRARHSTRAVARTLCLLLGLTLQLQAFADLFLISLEIIAGLPRAPWFWPLVALQASIAFAVGVWMPRPAARGSTQKLFARIGGREAQSRPETALAPLLGYGSSLEICEPLAVVAGALQVFEPIELSVPALREMGEMLFAPAVELHRARAHWTLRSWRTSASRQGRRPVEDCEEARAADCYVVYSPADNASEKLHALCVWVAKFETERGRPPRVWLSSLCNDPSLSRIELLEHMPTYIGRSKRLLVLGSSHGITHLWNAVECYVFLALGRRVEQIDVSVVAGQSQMDMSDASRRTFADAASNAYASSVVSAFDTFHVMLTSMHDEDPEVCSRLLHAVDLVGVAHFNSVVRKTASRVQYVTGMPP